MEPGALALNASSASRPLWAETVHHDLQVQLVVLGNEDTTLPRLRPGLFRLRPGLFPVGQGQDTAGKCKDKGAALATFAFKRQVAAHETGQRAAYGQSQSRPLIALGHSVKLLGKGGKYLLLKLVAHATAGVGNSEGGHDSFPVLRFL